MYKHIDVNKVLEKLYEKNTATDTELLSKFMRVSNLIKLKDPDSYKNMRAFTNSGYRCYAIQTNYQMQRYNMFFTIGKSDEIITYLAKNNIELDEDRYLLCIPETFSNFVLCEKFKNVETYYKKLFLYENNMDADHILNDCEKLYLFFHTLKENGVTGTVHLYNVDKNWSVPVLSNEGDKIYGLGKSVKCSSTKDNTECLDMRSAKLLSNPERLNATSNSDFTKSDVLHLAHAMKSININSFINGIREKNVFMGRNTRQNDKSLETIKSAILSSMYDK